MIEPTKLLTSFAESPALLDTSPRTPTPMLNRRRVEKVVGYCLGPHLPREGIYSLIRKPRRMGDGGGHLRSIMVVVVVVW